MITTIYYSLAIIAYSIFLIQFTMSMFGVGDTDVDLDIDGDSIGDLSWGDIFSFKGLIHFLMGCAGWLSLRSYTGNLQWFDYPIAIVLGFVFILILVMVTKALLKLKHEPTGQTEEDFIGHVGVITVVNDDNTYYVTMPEFFGYELKAYSDRKYKLGEEVFILKSENGKYYI